MMQRDTLLGTLRTFLRSAISTQVLLVFFCLQANTELSCKVASCYCSPPDLCSLKAIKLCNSPLRQKTKIPRFLSQVGESEYSDISAFKQLLSDGRTGGALEPSIEQ
jgi:hypothetical protein